MPAHVRLLGCSQPLPRARRLPSPTTGLQKIVESSWNDDQFWRPPHACVPSRSHAMRKFREVSRGSLPTGKGGVHGVPAVDSRNLSKAQPQPGEAIGIGFLPGAWCKGVCMLVCVCARARMSFLSTRYSRRVARVESCCQTKGSESTKGQLRKVDSSSAISPNHRARTGVRAPIDSTRGGGGRKSS